MSSPDNDAATDRTLSRRQIQRIILVLAGSRANTRGNDALQGVGGPGEPDILRDRAPRLILTRLNSSGAGYGCRARPHIPGMGSTYITTWTVVLSFVIMATHCAPHPNCGVKDEHRSENGTRRRFTRSTDSEELLMSREKVIELSLICDTLCYETITNAQKIPELFLGEVVRDCNKRMASVGTRVVISEMHVWTKEDLFEISTDGNTLIATTKTFRENVLLPRHWTDVTFLVTGSRLYNANSEIEGLMSLASVCTENAAGLLAYTTQTLDRISHNMAHELGHALGMNHDDRSSCSCIYGLTGCVMTPVASASAMSFYTWSSCSITEYANLLDHQHTECLYNIPNTVYNATMVQSMTCGNGVVEEDEECDCGGGCSDSCCLCCSSSCRFLRNGRCAQGACCNTATCQFHPTNKMCRESLNADCDQDQYCDGDSAQCPELSHGNDGNSCTGDGGEVSYCYQGQCRTRNSQCKTYWNEDYNNAADACYEYSINRYGFYGNCGAPGVDGATSYTGCSASGNPNYLCGTLQCSWPDSTNIYLDTSVYRKPLENPAITNTQCRVLSHGIWEVPSEGPVYVDDGVKCGDDKVCLDRSCLDKNEVYAAMGPYDRPAFCGNGNVEEGEECDCGARAQDCECCNSETCMFRPADDGCQFNECGLCSGKHANCTLQRADLTPCDEGRGQCYKAACQSTNLQCKKYFEDENAVAAVDVMKYNANFNITQWNAGGYLLQLDNAWQSLGEYVPANGDGLCGILLCNSTNTGSIYGPYNFKYTTVTFFLQPEFFSGTKCVYRRMENARNRTVVYHKYSPLLVEHGSPCSVGDQPGYCATNRIKMDRFGMTSYMSAECVV